MNQKFIALVGARKCFHQIDHHSKKGVVTRELRGVYYNTTTLQVTGAFPLLHMDVNTINKI